VKSSGEGRREGGKRQRARERDLRETENPNVLGWLAKSLFSKVDFPEPEGPEITIGLGFEAARVRLVVGREVSAAEAKYLVPLC
jgi:hypothetical protein